MNEQVEKLLAETSRSTFEKVARGALGDDSASLVGNPSFSEIDTPHNDRRTIGIVRVSGLVSVGNSSDQSEWSSVVKVIDQSVPANVAAIWGFPENEIKVYELGLLNDDEVPMRSARCYLSQAEEGELKILWLEDLSGAPQPPWNLEHFISAANHLGQFNGYHFARQTELPIEILRDAFFLRMSAFEWHAMYVELAKIPDDPILRRVFGDTPIEHGLEYSAAFERALEIAKSLPHGLAFGDSHARNMFPLGSETVGIDWASLTNDPVGCDIGVLIGSPLSFTEAELRLSAKHEPEIYDSYIDGLRSGGWNGNLDHVRLAFFMQFSLYVLMHAGLPLRYEDMKTDAGQRAHMEQRFGIPLEQFPELKAQAVALIPKYGAELKQLLKRVESNL